MTRFVGFSTANKVRAPYELSDSALVKRDLLNEFYTRKGERVMRPNFGSIVWDLLMDPSTSDLEEAVRTDINRIASRDPRITVRDIRVLVAEHTIRAEVDLTYIQLNDTDTLYLEFVRNISQGVS